jgi:carbamoyltransferase
MLGAEPGAHCSVPGKLMGYAAFGTPNPEIADWLVENDYFRNIWTDPSPFFRSARRRFGFSETFLDLRNEFVQNVAATFQWMFENEATQKVLELQEKTGAEYLYYAGGCALNIVTNTKIVDSGAFWDVCIPPCCNDSGLSIGAAAFVEWRKHGILNEHGPFLNNFGTSENAVETETVRAAAETILAGGVVGVCNGAGEAGPRALGNRSLLARADDPALAFKLSVECKKREWYRPVAPIVLLRNAPRFTDADVRHSLARYMLLDYFVPEAKREGIRGAVHVNGTARMQTIENREENPFIYELLTFLEEHGVYALINTSFNAAGEPIVHTPEQALASMRSMGLDGLVLNQRWVK